VLGCDKTTIWFTTRAIAILMLMVTVVLVSMMMERGIEGRPLVIVPMLMVLMLTSTRCSHDLMLLLIAGMSVVRTAPQQRMQRHGARRQDC